MKKNELIRINVYISKSTSLSRRKADIAIDENRVKINGHIAHQGDKVGVDDVVTLDGKTVEIYEKNTTYVLNKPKGYICSSYDPHMKHYARELIKVDEQEMLHSIGRLDKDSEGLIFFTTDGELTEKITHPKNQIEKEYYVKTENPISNADIRMMKTGVYDKKDKLTVKNITLMTEREALIVLTEGKNKEIRRIFEVLNNNVVSLVRLRIGGFSMPLSLKTGMFKKMSDKDISSIFSLK